MEFTISRTYHEHGTNGNLFLDGALFCHTIELPWLDNMKSLSCIPEGRYQVVKRTSNKFGKHMLLQNVQGRGLILIHPANNALKELKGCIAPVSVLQGPGIGLRSRIPFEALCKLVYEAIDNNEEVFVNIQSK